MSKGRCSGCGFEGSPRSVIDHILSCAGYAELFTRSPSQALEPEAEFERHQEWLKSDEGQAEKEAATAEASKWYRSSAEALLQKQRDRWGGRNVPQETGALTRERGDGNGNGTS